MINDNIKERKIALLKQNIRYLKSLQNLEENAFLMNYEKILASRHAIFEAIQICIDLAFHICAHKKLPTPTNYREAFIILAQNNLMNSELAKKMEAWTGLRFIITHIYETVDNTRLLDLIKNELGDLDEFIEYIESF